MLISHGCRLWYDLFRIVECYKKRKMNSDLQWRFWQHNLHSSSIHSMFPFHMLAVHSCMLLDGWSITVFVVVFLLSATVLVVFEWMEALRKTNKLKAEKKPVKVVKTVSSLWIL